ncbi:MAG: FISUMP domain-containing protein [Bacteroidales bacterium]|nr:FISUMP domain-containing protein [Bacteroidales bacterium]
MMKNHFLSIIMGFIIMTGSLYSRAEVVITLSGNSVCEGNTATLTANVSGTTPDQYLWYRGQYLLGTTTANEFTTCKILAPVAITVKVVTGSDTVAGTPSTIVMNELPPVTISGTPAFCTGSNTIISVPAEDGNTYAWTSSNGFTANTASVTINQMDNYTVIVTDMNLCSNSSTIQVTENVLPIVSVSDTSICEGQTIELIAPTIDDAIHYELASGIFPIQNENSAFNHTSCKIFAPTHFTWRVTDANGCVGENTFTVNPISSKDITLTCPEDMNLFLAYGACDTLLNIGTATAVHSNEFATTISNNLIDNRFDVGTISVEWVAEDGICSADTCVQTITIAYPPCISVTDVDGNSYPAVRIGCICWMAENLRTTRYSDMSSIAKIYDYENASRLAHFRHLYTWYSAIRVAENDDEAIPIFDVNNRVRGACPEHWALPSADEYNDMIYHSNGSEYAKSADLQYWLTAQMGTKPGSGFNARGGGIYSSVTDRYEHILSTANFWTASTPASVTHSALSCEFGNCQTETIISYNKSFGFSVRCIKVE